MSCWRHRITDMQSQIRSCLSGDLTTLLLNDYPEFLGVIDPEELRVILLTTITFGWLVQKEIEKEHKHD